MRRLTLTVVIASMIIVGCSSGVTPPADTPAASEAPTASLRPTASASPAPTIRPEPSASDEDGLAAACAIVDAAEQVDSPILPMLEALSNDEYEEAFDQGEAITNGVDAYLKVHEQRRGEVPEGLQLSLDVEAREADYDVTAALSWLFDKGVTAEDAQAALKDLNHLHGDLREAVDLHYWETGGCP